MAHGIILGALAEQIQTEDVELLLDRTTTGFSKVIGSSLARGMQRLLLLDTPPSMLATIARQACRRPASREVARQVAFRERGILELYRRAAGVGAAEIARHLLENGRPLTADQEAVYSQLGEELFTAYFSGGIGKSQLMQLALAWKGATDALGWAGVAPTLTPVPRRLTAYVLGVRYTAMDRRADAARFFHLALDGTPPDSPLDRLAHAAAEGAKPKSQK